MRVQIDLREWCDLRLQESKILVDQMPTVDLSPDSLVWDAVTKALKAATARVLNDSGKQELDRYLDPASLHFWILGFPFEVVVEGRDYERALDLLKRIYTDRIRECASPGKELRLSTAGGPDVATPPHFPSYAKFWDLLSDEPLGLQRG